MIRCECSNLWGKLTKAIVVGHWTVLQDSYLSVGQIQHHCDCLLSWLYGKRYYLFIFIVLFPYANLTSFIMLSGKNNVKAWYCQKFHLRQNFVVLPDLWALRVYFNPQLIPSKFHIPCKSGCFWKKGVLQKSKNPLSFSSLMSHH